MVTRPRDTVQTGANTGIPIIDRLQSKYPNSGFVYAAIDNLKSKGDVVRFFDAYMQWLIKFDERHKHSELFLEEYTKQEIRNIFALGHYNRQTAERWSIIEDVNSSEFTMGDENEESARMAARRHLARCGFSDMI
jgi:hypothetical protein